MPQTRLTSRINFTANLSSVKEKMTGRDKAGIPDAHSGFPDKKKAKNKKKKRVAFTTSGWGFLHS